MRDDHLRSDSLAWRNSTAQFWTMHASHECAVIRSQSDPDTLPLLPLICVCIYHLLWTYIFIWGAIHGILSILPSTEVERVSNAKGSGRQLHADIPPLDMLPDPKKRPVTLVRKGRGIIRDTAVDEDLSRTLISPAKLVMKGILLLPARSGFFAPVMILVVPRSMLLDILTTEAFAWITFRERARAPTCLYSRPVCVPWASPSLRQHIIAKVMDSFQCTPSVNSLHEHMQCYNPKSSKQDVSAIDELGRAGLQLLSYTIRSRTGTSSRPHNRTSTSATAKSEGSFSLLNTKVKDKNHKQLPPNKEREQDQSDEDEEDRKRPLKRKRLNKSEAAKLRLPCIFHVLDPNAHIQDPRWKFCNPETASYPDPSALS
jgi:hypothetical protein